MIWDSTNKKAVTVNIFREKIKIMDVLKTFNNNLEFVKF